MKGFGSTDEVSVFSLLRKQINVFEPLKLVDFQEQMLNNDKYANWTILYDSGSSQNVKSGLPDSLSLDTIGQTGSLQSRQAISDQKSGLG